MAAIRAATLPDWMARIDKDFGLGVFRERESEEKEEEKEEEGGRNTKIPPFFPPSVYRDGPSPSGPKAGTHGGHPGRHVARMGRPDQVRRLDPGGRGTPNGSAPDVPYAGDALRAHVHVAAGLPCVLFEPPVDRKQ